MKKEEIYFLRTVGLLIKDEKEAVTTDSVDKFPNITTYLEVLKKITESDWTAKYPSLKNCIYISCMMHYTIEVYRKNLISQEIFDKVMHKAEDMLGLIASDEIIALTLLYEGPHYLHPEIYPVYEKAGYSRVIKHYSNIFGPLIEHIEKEKKFSVIYGKEYEAYMDLYHNFVKLDE